MTDDLEERVVLAINPRHYKMPEVIRQRERTNARAAIAEVRRWEPIESAPRDGGSILLAHFDKGSLVWANAGAYETETLGYVQRASNQGWYVTAPPMFKDWQQRHEVMPVGFVGTTYPPTHWMLLPHHRSPSHDR